jgi:hypothetical protein
MSSDGFPHKFFAHTKDGQFDAAYVRKGNGYMSTSKVPTVQQLEGLRYRRLIVSTEYAHGIFIEHLKKKGHVDTKGQVETSGWNYYWRNK